MIRQAKRLVFSGREVGMYRVEVDGRECSLSSLEELAKWLRQERISNDTPVIIEETGIEVYVDDIIVGRDVEPADDAGPGSDGFSPDPEEELERKLAYIQSRPPSDFSAHELEALRSYWKALKKQDANGLVDWQTATQFRKLLRKVEMAAQDRERAQDLDTDSGGGYEESYLTVEQYDQPYHEEPALAQPAPPSPYRTPPPVGAARRKPPEGEKSIGWYHSPFIVILALIFLTPIGLILMWTAPLRTMRIRTRLILTVIFGALWFQGLSDDLGIDLDSLSEFDLEQKIKELETMDFESLINQMLSESSESSVEFGAGFVKEPRWAVTDSSSTYFAKSKIYYLVRGISCSRNKLQDSVQRKKGSEYKTIRENDFDWNPGHDQYAYSFTPQKPGVYRVQIKCGGAPVAEGSFKVAKAAR